VDILVVDDDPGMVDLISILLKFHGHRPIKAYGGKEALEAARAEPPDIILLDIMMPEIDGFEVLRQLRLDETTKDVPVIFVTAIFGPEFEERAMSLGAQGFVGKPYCREKLMTVIHRVASEGIALNAKGRA
jgi:CheY-like chemotaxis protein